jgi:hypothetical protein
MVGPTLASVKYSRLGLPSGTLGGATRTQEFQHLLDANHVAVLGVHVVEVRLVGIGVAVPHGLAGHEGPEAVLEGVDGRGPHAARVEAPVMMSVSTPAAVRRLERPVPKKSEAKSLLRTGSVSRGARRGSISDQRVPASRVRSAGTLSMKAAAVSLSDSR